MRQLAQVNAQWQEAHRSLNAQSEDLRQRASEVQQLQAQVAELRTFEAGYLQMEQRVRECEQSLQQSLEDAARLQQERQADQAAGVGGVPPGVTAGRLLEAPLQESTLMWRGAIQSTTSAIYFICPALRRICLAKWIILLVKARG